MSPTMVYNEFKTLFPDFKIISYSRVKTDDNAIIMTDEWGQQYHFKSLGENMWIFETIKMFLKRERS